jgi:hypothetical protein
MLKKAKGKSKVGAEAYKINDSDVQAISYLARDRYAPAVIKHALEKNNGNYQDTIRYLFGGN